MTERKNEMEGEKMKWKEKKWNGRRKNGMEGEKMEWKEKKWIIETIQNKNGDIFEKRHWYNTPKETDDWDCIYESRGHGVPLWACGDTADKLVISLEHLNEYKNMYEFKIEGDVDGWNNSVSSEIINEANHKMYQLGLYLSQKYPIQLCFVQPHSKGYTSFLLIDIKECSQEDFNKLFEHYNQLLLFVKTHDSEIEF